MIVCTDFTNSYTTEERRQLFPSYSVKRKSLTDFTCELEFLTLENGTKRTFL